MTTSIKYQTRVHFRCGQNGRKHLETGDTPTSPAAGRVPRVSRLMALAIRFDGLIRDGVVTDQAELARLGHVTRARLTQIMNLLHLAPDIQEALLFLPRVERGKEPIRERQLRPISAIADWQQQRRMWKIVQWKTLAIYGKITGQAVLKSLSVNSEARRPVLELDAVSDENSRGKLQNVLVNSTAKRITPS